MESEEEEERLNGMVLTGSTFVPSPIAHRGKREKKKSKVPSFFSFFF